MRLLLTILATLLTTSFQRVVKRQTSNKRVVCYTTNWNVWRSGPLSYNTEDIDPFLCTHLIYAFITADVKSRTLISIDSYVDVDIGGLRNTTALKSINPDLKVMVSVGGWNEGSRLFTKIASSKDVRDDFVANSIKYLRDHDFDGLDIDWQYPAQREGGVPEDKENYAALIKEFREAFEAEAELSQEPELLLSLVISAIPGDIEGFDIPTVTKYVDFVNLVAYEYFTSTGTFINHHSPLYPLLEDLDDPINSVLNADASVRHLLELGMTPNRINLGIPTYGRAFILQDPDEHTPGSYSAGQGSANSTLEKGYIPYFEICKTMADWTVERVNDTAWGPYAYKGVSWVGYDDPKSVANKAKYAVSMNLGGLMFWTIDDDDFLASCHSEEYPLVKSARRVFFPIPQTTLPPPTTTKKVEVIKSTESSTRESLIVGMSSATTEAPSKSSQPPANSASQPTQPPVTQGIGGSFPLSVLFGGNATFPALPFTPGNVFFQNINIYIYNIGRNR